MYAAPRHLDHEGHIIDEHIGDTITQSSVRYKISESGRTYGMKRPPSLRSLCCRGVDGRLTRGDAFWVILLIRGAAASLRSACKHFPLKSSFDKITDSELAALSGKYQRWVCWPISSEQEARPTLMLVFPFQRRCFVSIFEQRCFNRWARQQCSRSN